MLTRAVLRVRLKCSKHPNFQPRQGAGAVKGACTRCGQLVAIHEQHQRLMRMLAETPAREYDQRPRKEAPDTRQQQLF